MSAGEMDGRVSGAVPGSERPSVGGLSPRQLWVLGDVWTRIIEATRKTWGDARREARLEKGRVEARKLKALAVRAAKEAAQTKAHLEETPWVIRPMHPLLAVVFTALLMGASYFTISSILGAADLPSPYNYLMPLGFGPVFVGVAEISTAAWLKAAADDGAARRQLIAWLLAPGLILASIGLLTGVGIKSMAVGASEPLTDLWAQLSSVVLFASLLLCELVGASALAIRQHAPGAREYQQRLTTATRAGRSAKRLLVKAMNAEARVASLVAQVTGYQDVAAGRGALAGAWGRRQLAKYAVPGDAMQGSATISAVHFDAPPTTLRPIAQPFAVEVRRLEPMPANPASDIDEEFERLLSGRGELDRSDWQSNQDPLPW